MTQFVRSLGMSVAVLLSAACGTGAFTAAPVLVPLGDAPNGHTLASTLYRPDGSGPVPLVVMSHGSPRSAEIRSRMGRVAYASQSRVFLDHKFAVLVPMRRGYGDTGGEWAEGFGPCDAARFFEAGIEGARDLEAVVRFSRLDPAIDSKRILLVGHSAGGFASLAAASRDLPGVVGVVNFAGGRGSLSPGLNCSPDRLVETIERYGTTTKVPSLWIYSENDGYFSPQLVRRMHEAYRNGGAAAELVMLPPYGADGHLIFSTEGAEPLWRPHVTRFLGRLGLLRRN